MKNHEKAMMLVKKEGYWKLKEWMEQNDLSNKGAAELLGLSVRQIIKVKNNDAEQTKRMDILINLWNKTLRRIRQREIRDMLDLLETQMSEIDRAEMKQTINKARTKKERSYIKRRILNMDSNLDIDWDDIFNV